MFAPVLDRLFPTAPAADPILVPSDVVDKLDTKQSVWRSGEPTVDLDWGMTGAMVFEETAATDDDEATTVH